MKTDVHRNFLTTAAADARDPQLPPNLPCGLDYGGCLAANVLPAFSAAGGNTAALRTCDTQSAAQRHLARLRCVGAKPTAADLVPALTLPGSP